MKPEVLQLFALSAFFFSTTLAAGAGPCMVEERFQRISSS